MPTSHGRSSAGVASIGGLASGRIVPGAHEHGACPGAGLARQVHGVAYLEPQRSRARPAQGPAPPRSHHDDHLRVGPPAKARSASVSSGWAPSTSAGPACSGSRAPRGGRRSRRCPAPATPRAVGRCHGRRASSCRWARAAAGGRRSPRPAGPGRRGGFARHRPVCGDPATALSHVDAHARSIVSPSGGRRLLPIWGSPSSERLEWSPLGWSFVPGPQPEGEQG